MKEKSKNLIVIIGNGFDLAHGLKTSYNDFANYYLEEIIVNELLNLDSNTSKSNGIIIDSFLNHFKKFTFKYDKISEVNNKTHQTNDKINFVVSCIQHKTKSKSILLEKLKESELIILRYVLENKFLVKLYENSYSNWFDIEQAYYEELEKIYNSPKENHNDKLKILNDNLQEIKEALKKYLNDKIKPTHNGDVNYSFENHFIDRENVSFINFNYTNTINCYRYSVNLNLNKNIHIHNSLSEDIIFGYGDDTDEMYQKMKASKNNSFLKYFKTFDYLKSKNYRKVLNQLAIFDKYDVLVIGHSLGGTDKTILKTILDDDSCQNIELLKRSDFDTDERYKELNLLEKEQLKEDNLFELYANLARIFDSEASLREKVIPFEWSINFPVMANYDYTKIREREKELFIEKSTLIDPGVY
ncbi:bacteriophage abortive infection AbiH family protein [Tenacibaculum finnmarkense genomovar ulcerans]|uniref:AbiH family protein n=1 Tax=Tenacibaculum finnmarkense TaxID=2781243 RepID=UPI001E4B2D38|nr:AbiH family protein [Tenacibaculum finnmarkense]MCD8422740.1 bacteriophage abortive infection AbiH family protein [Tenacibaculum finnmarkense genomovar ulcerans]